MTLSRNSVFSRVIVDHLLPDGARVTWQLAPHFLEPGTRSFQLQTSQTGEVTDEEWVDVGLPTATLSAIDDTRRRIGKALDTVYRVELTIGSQVWYSPASPAYGLLSWREWLLARGIIRRRSLKYSKRDGADGWLLKRRDAGEQLTTATTADFAELATDEISGLVLNSRQPTTLGTEYAAGYYPPVPMYMVFSNLQNQLQRDEQRGMTNDTKLQGECLAYPAIDTRDVWIAAHDDRRYYLSPIQTVAELRQVPLVIACELQVAPTGDAIYQLVP